MSAVKQFIFDVPGDPVGKQRPRVTRSGHAFTPHRTVEYENLVRACFRDAFPDAQPLDEPVSVQIVAFHSIPKSWSKAKREQARKLEILPGKPDCDNIAKSICDALNGVAYTDDRLICRLDVRKQYGTVPMVVVIVKTR